MAWIRHPKWVASAALVGVVLGTGSAPAANLFDAIASIFGGGGGEAPPSYQPQEPVRQHYRYEDLEPVEAPYRRHRERRPREHVERERVRERKPANVAMDPVKVPDWYLKDDTLRRGDIVVLTNGVFVFEGSRAPHVPEDFIPLERSRLPANERSKIAEMTGYRPERLAAAAAGPKTASADVETTASVTRSR